MGAGETVLALVLALYTFSASAQLTALFSGLSDDCRNKGPRSLGMQLHGTDFSRIPSERIWATSQRPERPPDLGRLFKAQAWVAEVNDINQHIGIDLDKRYTVTGVATQGQRGSGRYVNQYYFQYSTDNTTWLYVTDDNGDPLMFDANYDDDGVITNTFKVPVVARFVRFNPQRWSNWIAMRVEIYGCEYEAHTATFDGKSRIMYDLTQQGWNLQSIYDMVKMRFRTNAQEGLLFFANGNQGDYFAIELVRGHLRLNIDLGTTSTSSGASMLEAGSLLDDNQWHDVEIIRSQKEITVSVDRVTVERHLNGSYDKLDLDRHLYVGAVPDSEYRTRGLTVRNGFVGCMENVVFNQMHIIKDMKLKKERFSTAGNVKFTCQMSKSSPYSFPYTRSHLKVMDSAQTEKVSVSFQFRTYDELGMMLYTKLKQGFVMLSIERPGYIKYNILGQNSKQGQEDQMVPEIEGRMKNQDPNSIDGTFRDGLWHSLVLDITTDLVNLTVDGYSWVTRRILKVQTAGDLYYIGGGIPEEHGFVGCMQNMQVGAVFVEPSVLTGEKANLDVLYDTCGMRDRCHPNPCEHNGLCTQTWNTFECNCDNTGYYGAVCHISKWPTSCDEVKQLDRTDRLEKAETYIDLDGSGPLDPFPVTCEFPQANVNETYVGHESENPTPVNGYQYPREFRQQIKYVINRQQMDELIARSEKCRQYIQYQCKQSRLLMDTGFENGPYAFGYWIGRSSVQMYHWGGASPGSRSCKCGLQEQCEDKRLKCNCDAATLKWTADEGYLVHKEHLPVMELHFGDTGTLTDNKEGIFRLGKLICDGDSLFNNEITFKYADATVEFETLRSDNSWDIRFQFRTKTETGIFIKNTGVSNFVEVKLYATNEVHFRFDVGHGIVTLAKRTSYWLNDDQWHTVHVERNRKESMLKVDELAAVTALEPQDQGFRPLRLRSQMVVGADVDYKNGFVGCMRGLQVNGKIMDLKGQASQGLYGVLQGCIGKCHSNPCLNGGVCKEFYSHYECDCTYTPYRGYICGRHTGTNFRAGQYIQYEFDASMAEVSTSEEFIQIGFSTQVKQGLLMQIINKDATEYITIEINNNGGIKVSLDVGFALREVATTATIDYANRQQHIATVRRTKNGRRISVKVDDYPESFEEYTLPEVTDTKLDHPKYIFLGANAQWDKLKGFEGCIYHVRFDDTIYPLKEAFRDPRPKNVYMYPNASVFRENMCAFEEYLYPPEPIEVRPTKEPKPTRDTLGYALSISSQDQAVLGGVLAVVFVVLVILLFLLYRYFSKQKGAYQTNEARGAQRAANPDVAIAHGQSGQPAVSGKKEWFL